MKIYRKLIILLFLGTCLSAYGTGFTLGGKELWTEVCNGNYENYSTEEAKTVCHSALMFYWAGYSHAQYELGVDMTLCPRTLDPSITEEYVIFLKNTKRNEKVDFIVLANDFFKSISECK